MAIKLELTKGPVMLTLAFSWLYFQIDCMKDNYCINTGAARY